MEHSALVTTQSGHFTARERSMPPNTWLRIPETGTIMASGHLFGSASQFASIPITTDRKALLEPVTRSQIVIAPVTERDQYQCPPQLTFHRCIVPEVDPPLQCLLHDHHLSANSLPRERPGDAKKWGPRPESSLGTETESGTQTNINLTRIAIKIVTRGLPRLMEATL